MAALTVRLADEKHRRLKAFDCHAQRRQIDTDYIRNMVRGYVLIVMAINIAGSPQSVSPLLLLPWRNDSVSSLRIHDRAANWTHRKEPLTLLLMPAEMRQLKWPPKRKAPSMWKPMS